MSELFLFLCQTMRVFPFGLTFLFPVLGFCFQAAAQTAPVQSVRQADAVCAQCHGEIYRRYLSTTMANGSGIATDRLLTGQTHQALSGMTYAVREDAGAALLSYARETEPQISGTEKLLYFLGSGNLGITYLYSIHGYLLESPVAYYAKSALYDMAPGLGGGSAMPGAQPMSAKCMRCHMSNVRAPDPGTSNHFMGAPFGVGGVACEQCHGDASRHVATRGTAPVVNPAKLDAPARDSVCISCHLEGDISVERKEQSIFHWKPGEDISRYITYFTVPGSGTSRSVSETEQLSASRCKRASGPSMSCTSCHDPHGEPPPLERVSFYRGKCLSCHTQPSFATAHFPETPDCTQCHMPKAGAQDTPHVAWTDHRILRSPQNAPPPARQLDPELASFLPAGFTPRDLGLAYYGMVAKGEKGYASRAAQLLLEAAPTAGNDPPLLVALGNLSRMGGHPDAARSFYGQALAADPVNLEASNDLAVLLAGAGETEKARDLLKGAFSRNEDDAALGINLASLQCRLGDVAESKSSLERVLLYNPGSDEARNRLRTLNAEADACKPHITMNDMH